MGDTKESESEQKNCNNKINDSGNNEQAGEKSTDSNNDIVCGKNSVETQSKILPDVQEEMQNKNSAKLNVESKVEIEKISNSNLKSTEVTIAKVKGGTVEGIRKSEHKKHATYSGKASTITINGKDSCPQTQKHIKGNKQEVNNNAEKPETENTESENKRCPIYFGIKSYLHQFYAPPDKDILKNGDYIQEDEFEFLVEPGKRRWRRLWFRVGMCIGLNLLLLGLVILLVGYLTPPRQAVVAYKDNLEIVDRLAIAFNRHLEICRFAGLCIFCSGAIIVMLTLLVSSYQQETTYSYTYVMGATVVPEIFIGNPLIGQRERCYNGAAAIIPITSTIQNIQPNMLTSNMCH